MKNLLVRRIKVNDKQTYTLNCDTCGEAFYSDDAFPSPQLCAKCLLVEKCLLTEEEVGEVWVNYYESGDPTKKPEYESVLNEAQLTKAIPIIREAVEKERLDRPELREAVKGFALRFATDYHRYKGFREDIITNGMDANADVVREIDQLALIPDERKKILPAKIIRNMIDGLEKIEVEYRAKHKPVFEARGVGDNYITIYLNDLNQAKKLLERIWKSSVG